MKTYVYSRQETVFYVVGVAGPGSKEEAFADALVGKRPRSFKHYEHDKPFRAMNDKRVMYVERIGSTANGASYRGKQLDAIAKRRAEEVMALYGENDMEIPPKKRRKSERRQDKKAKAA